MCEGFVIPETEGTITEFICHKIVQPLSNTMKNSSLNFFSSIEWVLFSSRVRIICSTLPSVLGYDKKRFLFFYKIRWWFHFYITFSSQLCPDQLSPPVSPTSWRISKSFLSWPSTVGLHRKCLCVCALGRTYVLFPGFWKNKLSVENSQLCPCCHFSWVLKYRLVSLTNLQNTTSNFENNMVIFYLIRPQLR